MYQLNVGAPKGLYVYWLDMELCGEFSKAYKCSCCSKTKQHNYRYAREYRNKLIDEFLVVRTSKRCYRVIYYNVEFNFLTYFSESNYVDCANHMKLIYECFKRIESNKENKGSTNKKIDKKPQKP